MGQVVRQHGHLLGLGDDDHIASGEVGGHRVGDRGHVALGVLGVGVRNQRAYGTPPGQQHTGRRHDPSARAARGQGAGRGQQEGGYHDRQVPNGPGRFELRSQPSGQGRQDADGAQQPGQVAVSDRATPACPPGPEGQERRHHEPQRPTERRGLIREEVADLGTHRPWRRRVGGLIQQRRQPREPQHHDRGGGADDRIRQPSIAPRHGQSEEHDRGGSEQVHAPVVGVQQGCEGHDGAEPSRQRRSRTARTARDNPDRWRVPPRWDTCGSRWSTSREMGWWPSGPPQLPRPAGRRGLSRPSSPAGQRRPRR